jgi:drug/metabolite transporter (DMT)-like permease
LDPFPRVLPLVLVVFSALLHAAWNTLLKRERDPRLASVPVVLVSAIVGTAIALGTSGITAMSGRAWAWSFAAGTFEATYFFTLGRALSLAPLGVVYTATRGGALLLVWPLSVVLLGERVTPWGLAGTLLVLVGLVATSHEATPVRLERRGLWFAAGCAVSIAGYHLSYKHALFFGASPAMAISVSMGLGVAANFAVIDERRAALAMVVRPTIVLAGVLCSLSFLLFLHALSRGGAGLMLTLRNTSVIFAMVFSLLIGERPPRLRWLGAGIVAVGAVLLSVR